MSKWRRIIKFGSSLQKEKLYAKDNKRNKTCPRGGKIEGSSKLKRDHKQKRVDKGRYSLNRKKILLR